MVSERTEIILLVPYGSLDVLHQDTPRGLTGRLVVGLYSSKQKSLADITIFVLLVLCPSMIASLTSSGTTAPDNTSMSLVTTCFNRNMVKTGLSAKAISGLVNVVLILGHPLDGYIYPGVEIGCMHLLERCHIAGRPIQKWRY